MARIKNIRVISEIRGQKVSPSNQRAHVAERQDQPRAGPPKPMNNTKPTAPSPLAGATGSAPRDPFFEWWCSLSSEEMDQMLRVANVDAAAAGWNAAIAFTQNESAQAQPASGIRPANRGV